MITGCDHVQVAIPQGGEQTAREFYGGMLGMTEVPKPTALAARSGGPPATRGVAGGGGCWFTAGAAVLHLGVQEPFTPALKAHPAFVVDDLEALLATLIAAGYQCIPADDEIAGVRRCHTHDPFGNRLEFQQA